MVQPKDAHKIDPPDAWTFAQNRWNVKFTVNVDGVKPMPTHP